MTAVELVKKIRSGELTASEAVEESLECIERLNPLVNAVITRLDDAARLRANELDIAASKGQLVGPLHGVPVLVKDLFDPVAGVRNTMGFVGTLDYVPQETASHIQRLIDAGAVIIGKTNVPEFGHKGVTDNQLFGPTCCPFDLARNAGGSSGGSAAAVACGMVTIAQGSDAGGSIRIPAANCGVVGLKLSYGRVPNTGSPNLFGSHTPFVHNGPLASTVQDAALAAMVMSGPDWLDPFSLPASDENLVARVAEPMRPLRIAYAPSFGGFPVGDDVAETVDRCIGELRESGLEIKESNLSFSLSANQMTQLWLRQVGRAYAAIFSGIAPEGADFVERYRSELPEVIVDMVTEARRSSALDVASDELLRSSVYRDLQCALDECDILLSPTNAVLPVQNSSDGCTVGPTEVAGQPTDPNLGWCLTHPVNFTGHPAASIPAGLSQEGLSVGLQIIGRRFGDGDVVAFAAEVERRRSWYHELECIRTGLNEQTDQSISVK